MFEFQKLEVYRKSKDFHSQIMDLSIIVENKTIQNQLSRAALSIPLNIAEGSGRFSRADRRNFFVIARGSVFECVAVLDILNGQHKLSDNRFLELSGQADELSRMLYAMIRNLENKK